MSSENENGFELVEAKKFIKLSTYTYIIMSLVGLNIILFSKTVSITSLFGLSSDLSITLQLLTVILAISILIIFASQLELVSESYRNFKSFLLKQIGPIGLGQIFYLSFLSSFAEEILFRGAIQPIIGLWFTSLLFGLLHLGPHGKVNVWTAWATFSGVVLGSLTEFSNSLWPAILVHFIVNFSSMTTLRFKYLADQNKVHT